MKGIITNIQRYSIHDGPGIRTVVFFKGCPLRCVWCCNPETQSFQPELEFIKSLCAQCGKCIEVCQPKAINFNLNCQEDEKIDRKRCTVCGECVRACPSEALRMVGEKVGVEEVIKEILKDKNFYLRSGGGITLSGGEPLSQPEFAYALLKKCHGHNIHTAVETCGAAPREIFERILPETDLFLFDIKHIDCTQHEGLTGISNKILLNNLKWLRSKSAQVILRLPLIPGLNTDEQNIRAVAQLAKDLLVSEIHLMPFHQMGKDKYRHLGRKYTLTGQKDMRLEEGGRKELHHAEEILTENNIKVCIGG